MDAFEIEVLGMISNDYEAVHTIRADLKRELGRSVSVEELEAALERLVALGLADAFAYDHGAGCFLASSVGSVPSSERWFRINGYGRAEYERFVA